MQKIAEERATYQKVLNPHVPMNTDKTTYLGIA